MDALVRHADGEFVENVSLTTPDTAYTRVQVGARPNPRTHKWDRDTVVEKSQAEIDAYDAARLDTEAQGRADGREYKAMMLFYLRDQLGRNPTPAERTAARTAFVQAYKSAG